MTPRALVVAVALAVGAAACAGAGDDKAGGQAEPAAHTVAKPVGKPVTLTLVTVDELWASEFAAAATRLSGGSIRIRTQVGGGWNLDYERVLVGHVRSGRAELASVGARAWDRMGVTSFRGLVAPFLVDSLELQQRLLQGPRVERMLDGVEPLGLVGLAVLPGPLRRPFGLSRPLLGPDDYRGTTIGIRFGRVAEATMQALGATVKGYRSGSLAGLDGAELDAWTIASNGYDKRGATLSGNVVLWARPETIVISRSAFMRLAPAQRAILRRAGREAVAPVRARIEKDQKEALEELCDRGSLSLAAATDAELASLRGAVRPVYAQLERDPATRKQLAEIRRLKGSAGSERLRCTRTRSAEAALEGRWSSTSTRGRATLELRRGRWVARLRDTRHVWTGTYAVTGERVRFVLETCSHNPCDPGAIGLHRWSVYRDALTLTQLSGSPIWWQSTSEPWRRAAG